MKEESKDKKGFIVYCDVLNDIEALTNEQCGVLFRAILARQAGEELPEMDAAVKVALSFISKSIDRNTDRYYKTCEARSEAGKKGGRPPKDEASESKKKQKKANETKTNQSEASESNTKTKKAITDNGERITDNGNRITEIGERITDTGDKQESVCSADAEPLAHEEKFPKHKYGEYNHVLLTDKEFDSLTANYGLDGTQDAIRYLDEYIEMKGAKYKSHYLALKKWVFDAVREKRQKATGQNNESRATQDMKGFYNMAVDWAKGETTA